MEPLQERELAQVRVQLRAAALELEPAQERLRVEAPVAAQEPVARPPAWELAAAKPVAPLASSDRQTLDQSYRQGRTTREPLWEHLPESPRR